MSKHTDHERTNTRIEDLSSKSREVVVAAVEALCHERLNKADEDHLISIVKDFEMGEDNAALWATVILKHHASLASAPALLSVLDSDYDYLCEAAAEAMIAVAQKYPDEALDLLENFIMKRIDHDPWSARLFAYEPIAALHNNSRAHAFLIKMFELDDKWKASLGNDLADSGDARTLVLLRRALEFAEQTHDPLDINELRYAYARLAGAPVRHYDPLDLYHEPWQKRWVRSLEDLGKVEDEDEDSLDTDLPKSPLLEDSPGSQELNRKHKKEQDIIDHVPLPDFVLDEYLTIRVRAETEERVDVALRLLGLDTHWNVEKVQKLINASSNPDQVMSLMFSNFQFPSTAALETVTPLLVDLWNTTPREELHGLTPEEMVAVPELRADNVQIEENWKKNRAKH